MVNKKANHSILQKANSKFEKLEDILTKNARIEIVNSNIINKHSMTVVVTKTGTFLLVPVFACPASQDLCLAISSP